jgi:hypothetical protein
MAKENGVTPIDPKILVKIKKCLALAASPNPNEAATALRQAHALMDKHGVSAHEITMADIGEARVGSKTMSRDKPANWEANLAALVGKAFGCQMMVYRNTLAQRAGHLNDGGYIFVGLKQQAEIASYTASVLIRKCKSSRQKWLTENCGGYGKGVQGQKARLTRVGDMYAEGWVASISWLVSDFANPPEVEAAIEQHIEANTSGNEAPVRAVDEKSIGRLEAIAASAGMRDAKSESLYRPMGTEQAPLALAGHTK